MKIRTYLIIIAVWLALPSMAQDNDSRQIFNEAEEAYDLGRIEQAKDLLESHINSLSSGLKLRAYRLLTLCCLSLDEDQQAEHYATLMLREDPYYTPTVDYAPRFIDLVNSLRDGISNTITTASSQEENMSEVPVPTTLITEEMIHNSGARNLQEVLAAYVPGMHIIDCNDDINISMRGIYSNGQEKILIMLNGHRLNSYTTNIASPDFSISLEKLKQIEVLRGPASSLYGGVALTAVVNLITKQGADVDGVEIKGGIGNYGQLYGNMLFGKRYFDLDLLVWGSIYKSSGEDRHIPEREDIYALPVDYATVGRIGNKPSYDFGFQLKWHNLQFLFDTHFSQVVSPFTITTLANTYEREKYKTFNGIKPSYATQSRHAELNYSRQLGKLNLRGALTFDNGDLTHYQVLNDYYLESDFLIGLDLPKSLDSLLRNNCGIARYINGQELSYGAQVKGDFSYINKGHHKGSLAFGAEYSHFKLDDVRYQVVYDFKSATPENSVLQEMGKDHEDSYNAFVQLKHQWHSLIFNAGFRYDHKIRYDHTKLDEFSPRLALILVRPKWNVKFSFSKSFVDAPYLYRKTDDFLGYLSDSNSQQNGIESDEKLSPETLHSIQLTFAGIQWIKGLNFEINGFYNKAYNLIMTHLLQHTNAGRNKTIGVELMGNYYKPRFTVDFNLTWTRTLKANLFEDELFTNYVLDSNIDANNNTPAIMSNAILSWKVTKRLKLFTHINFQSKQTTYNTDVVVMSLAMRKIKWANELLIEGNYDTAKEELEFAFDLLKNVIYKGDMAAQAIVNVGAEYQLGKVTLGVNIHNLFDSHYNRSGMNTKLVPQKGRWFMATIAYKF